VLFREGDPCRAFPFVLDGEIRVARGTPEGRSLELYRVGPGDVCLLSTSCAFSARLQAVHATATRLWPAPPEAFLTWMAAPAFSEVVFGVFGERLAESIGTVREIGSRLLKRFEQRGWIALGRERVAIVDAAALRTLAEGGEPAEARPEA
jgi:CRP/FNR family transcriptional regulator